MRTCRDPLMSGSDKRSVREVSIIDLKQIDNRRVTFTFATDRAWGRSQPAPPTTPDAPVDGHLHFPDSTALPLCKTAHPKVDAHQADGCPGLYVRTHPLTMDCGNNRIVQFKWERAIKA